MYIQTVEHRLTTLQLSLELLSNICSQDDAEGIFLIAYRIKNTNVRNI